MAKDHLTIVIDPGHGGDNPEGEADLGASYNGVFEKEIDLITANALYDELSQYGNVTVYMTRTEDVHMELKDRADFAASVGADMFISVHYNASAHHRFYGTEIFTSAYGEEYAKAYSLAENIMRYWVEAGNDSKGIKVRLGENGDYYGVIRMCRKHGIPAMILEHGYLDNDTDFDRLGSREFWEYMGRLDGAAIADYYGLAKGHEMESVREELSVSVPEDHITPDETPPEEVSVRVDAYDAERRILSYTVSAAEPDGFLMYYDLDTKELAEDEELGFMHLKLWDRGETSMKGEFEVPEGYRGPFVARVYNNYERYTDTEPFFIPEEMYPKEASENEAEPESASELSDDSGIPEIGKGGGEPSMEDSASEEGQRDPQSRAFRWILAILAFLLSLLVLFLMLNAATRSRKHRRRTKE